MLEKLHQINDTMIKFFNCSARITTNCRLQNTPKYTEISGKMIQSLQGWGVEGMRKVEDF